MVYVLPFASVGMDDVAVVGGKNASLGEMISSLSSAGVRVPDGFATSADAFKDFLAYNDLDSKISAALSALDPDDLSQLASVGAQIRQWIYDGAFCPEFESALKEHFAALNGSLDDTTYSYAVRSSATAEDLPDASFAGQQESYLNVRGIDDVLDKIKLVFASLYNDRAISYRVHKGFCHDDVAISAGVQRMVRSDMGSSGVMFSLDTESGFDGVVFITSAYGLGECVVQGAVNPDEFYISKHSLEHGSLAVISKKLGSKLIKMVFSDDPKQKVRIVDVEQEQQAKFSLDTAQLHELARYAMIIERHYKRPMDIEWGLDGVDGKLYILQARPETVKSQKQKEQTYILKEEGKLLITGRAIGQKISVGTVKIIDDISQIHRVQEGDVLVTDMTDPNWEPVMKKAAAIITNRGGRTCHAAIIARELGIGAVVGTSDATKVLQDGQTVSVSCVHGDEGHVYDGALKYEIKEQEAAKLNDAGVQVMMNVGNPSLAFGFAKLPNDGVGLARLEFIINNHISIHPSAILDYPNVPDDIKSNVAKAMRGYDSAREFFVSKLSEGIAMIAAAFYPKPVIIRLSDFKSNEYRKLIGGELYEMVEENPMLGFRGASRYLAPSFAQCFALECEALRIVREQMALDNVKIMVPFVRTLAQARSVVELLAKNGLRRGENGLQVIMMCEVPSNAILCDEFLEYFDGFSIGSNDMTQLTLGLDRDSGLDVLVADFDERDEAVLYMLERAIDACKRAGKYIGICGQGPSDHPDLAMWLKKRGITSMSLNPDSVISTWQMLEKI